MIAINVVMWRMVDGQFSVTGWGLLFALLFLSMVCSAVSR